VPCHQEHELLMRLASDPEFARLGCVCSGFPIRMMPRMSRVFSPRMAILLQAFFAQWPDKTIGDLAIAGDER
jgi:hypothetical protein